MNLNFSKLMAAAGLVFTLNSAPLWAADAGQAAWEADVKKTNAAYATDEFAVLKIDDAVYLNPGETAWLDKTGAADGKTAWRLSPSDTALVKLTYQKNFARFERPGETVSFDPKDGGEMSLGNGIAVKAQLTQTAPGEIGLRVFAYNQQNPAAKAFKGLDYYPYTKDFIVETPFILDTPAPADFQTSRGTWKRFWRVGHVEFTLKGQAVSLPIYAGDQMGAGGLSIFFKDETTGKTTYGVGRYLDLKTIEYPPETVTLDFNYAYNPLCARTPHYNCPYAQDAVPLAVEAGEKAPPEH